MGILCLAGEGHFIFRAVGRHKDTCMVGEVWDGQINFELEVLLSLSYPSHLLCPSVWPLTDLWP